MDRELFIEMEMTNNKLITDRLLDSPEQTVNPDIKSFVKQVKIVMKFPECAQMIGKISSNLVGGKEPISTEVDDAMKCLINYYSLEIDKSCLQGMNKENADKLHGIILQVLGETIRVAFCRQGLLKTL